jgi:uncharacterized damage-inducible protein DinB
MHTHLTEVFARLDAQRAALRAAVERVPRDQRQERPAPDRWSVAEVLEHLGLVEARFTEWVEKAIATAREGGLGPERDARAALPSDLESMLSDRTRQRTAPPPVIPQGTMTEEAAWGALDRARATFRATVMSADGLALNTVTVAHPAFGTLSVYQWVELIAVHEARHTAQIQEIGDYLASSH